MLKSGSILGPYRIEGVLGAGSMSIVYRARRVDADYPVALKVLAPELGGDPAFLARFQREKRLHAAFDHPHIVPVYETGTSDAGTYMAMRVIEGRTLKERIVTSRLDPWLSMHLLTQVAAALDAAHERSLVHRDVKPQNILIGPRDHAYLTDFGLTTAGEGARLTQTGQVLGTIDYISPEVARGEAATRSSDVYSLACVLCECLTGNVPFPRATQPAVLFAHMTEPAPRISERRPELPAALDDVLAVGLAKDAAERPASASALLDQATRALASAEAVPA